MTIGARLYDGPTTLINRAHTRTDALNLTNIFDNVTPANNAALWYSPANRLQNESCLAPPIHVAR